MEILSSKKINDYSIEITKQPVISEPVKQIYERDFLEKQLVQIQAQQDKDNETRETEKAEVQAILKEMDNLKIIVKQETK